MNKDKLKQELHSIIDNTNDEEILNIMKEDLVEYQTQAKKFDDLSYLSANDRAELEELAIENLEKDTVSFEEYKKIMHEWFAKL